MTAREGNIGNCYPEKPLSTKAMRRLTWVYEQIRIIYLHEGIILYIYDIVVREIWIFVHPRKIIFPRGTLKKNTLFSRMNKPSNLSNYLAIIKLFIFRNNERLNSTLKILLFFIQDYVIKNYSRNLTFNIYNSYGKCRRFLKGWSTTH